VFQHGSGYFAVSMLTKATGFLLLPVITSYLSLDEYGLYANIQSAQNIMYLLATLGFDAAYSRFIYDYNSSGKRLKLLTSTVVTAYLYWNLFYLLLSGTAFYFLLASWGYKKLLLVLFLPFITIFQQFIVLNTSLMQSRHQTRKLLTISTTSFFISQGIMLTLLIKYSFGVESFFIAQFIVNLAVMAIHLRMLINEGLVVLTRIRKALFTKLGKYALGYIPASFSGWIFSLSDRYIITYYVSISMAGKYAFLMQFAILIQIIMQAVNTSYTPIFMRLMKDGSRESLRKIEAYYTVIFYFLLLLFLGLSLFLPAVIENIFPEKYRGDYFLIPILSLSYVFLALRKMFANILVYHKKSLWISISGYIPAAVNLLLNFIFVPMYGMYAAAWSTFASFVLYGVIVFLMAQKLQHLNFAFLKIALLFFASLAIVYLNLQNYNLILSFVYFAAFVLLGGVTGIYRLIRE
jgi:O-antigen/teichoic acid export membrane protein